MAKEDYATETHGAPTKVDRFYLVAQQDYLVERPLWQALVWPKLWHSKYNRHAGNGIIFVSLEPLHRQIHVCHHRLIEVLEPWNSLHYYHPGTDLSYLPLLNTLRRLVSKCKAWMSHTPFHMTYVLYSNQGIGMGLEHPMELELTNLTGCSPHVTVEDQFACSAMQEGFIAVSSRGSRARSGISSSNCLPRLI